MVTLADAHAAFPLGSGPSTLCLSRRAFGRRPKFGHPLAEPRANEAEALESRYVGNLLQRHAASFGLKEETSNDVEKAAEEAPSHKAEPASNDGSFGHPEACECLAASQRTDAHSVLRTLCPLLARCAGVPACGSCMATASRALRANSVTLNTRGRLAGFCFWSRRIAPCPGLHWLQAQGEA